MSSILKQSGYLLVSAFALALSLHSAAAVYACVSAHAHHTGHSSRLCLKQAVASLNPKPYLIRSQATLMPSEKNDAQKSE